LPGPSWIIEWPDADLWMCLSLACNWGFIAVLIHNDNKVKDIALGSSVVADLSLVSVVPDYLAGERLSTCDPS